MSESQGPEKKQNMWRAICWVATIVLAGSGGFEAQAAAAANPSLTALDSGVNDAEAVSRELEIADLDVRVEVVGNVAETTVTARFVNSGGNDLEGTFTLQLPDGAVVSGYALDVAARDVIEGRQCACRPRTCHGAADRSDHDAAGR